MRNIGRSAYLLPIVLILSGITAGCMREIQKDTRISMRAPDKVSSKAGALSAMPTDRKACYGVRVSGPDIPKAAATACDGESGISAGFVAAGKIIEVNVPKGEDRKIDLYLYLQKEGEDLACPTMGTHFDPGQFEQLYKIGNVSKLTLADTEQAVTIEADFPGVANHLAQQLSLPVACLAGTTPTPTPTPAPPKSVFQVSAGQQVATGTGIRLYGRVGRPLDGTVLSGTGIKMKMKVR